MINFLLKLAIKDEPDYTDPGVRLRVGYLAGSISLLLNIALSIIKLTIGFMISSIGVVVDGFNNLSDAASSVITLLGFKISNKPSDKEHPYGHARAEYVSALIIALLVVLVGLQFIKSSYDRIINPISVKFELLSFSILTVSILFKLWMFYFNKVLGNKIDSSSLKATATDALGDVLTTSIVVFSLVIGRYTTLPIDGFIGLIVALIILYSGYLLVSETISALIGEAPPKELTNSIYRDILTYDYITGAHDLVIHSYGAGNTMATIDVEFPSNIDVLTIHNVIDMAERQLGERYNMTLVIHIDPLEPESKERYELRNKIKAIAFADPRIKSIHDFLILSDENDKKIIEFHLVVNGNMLEKHETQEVIKSSMEDKIQRNFTDIVSNVVVDIEY